MPSDRSNAKKKLTFGELKSVLDRLTPDQLAMEVMWAGDDRGGWVGEVEILKEDQINPSGDGWEAKSDVRKYLIEDEDFSEKEADEEIAGESVVAVQGQPVLLTDIFINQQDPNKEAPTLVDLSPRTESFACIEMHVVPPDFNAERHHTWLLQRSFVVQPDPVGMLRILKSRYTSTAPWMIGDAAKNLLNLVDHKRRK